MPCEEGTFSEAEGAEACAPWRDCAVDESVLSPGSATEDRTCAPCPRGTIGEQENQEACTTGQIVAGNEHTCVLRTDGSVRCWGNNQVIGYGFSEGAVGDDEDPATAGDLDLGEAATQLAAGGHHTCALLASGGVRCWGQGARGKLGYGNTDDVLSSIYEAGVVDVGGDVEWLAAGGHRTCVILAAGAVRCWGANGAGELGYGDTDDVGDDEAPSSAGDVDVGGTAVALAMGWEHTCALLDDGAVRCWGANYDGMLGLGHTEDVGDDEDPADEPVVDLGGPAVAIWAGLFHTCAKLEDGSLTCWGFDERGQLGRGTVETIGDDESPVDGGTVATGGEVRELVGGNAHSCARLGDGSVRCWGDAEYGVLGSVDTAWIGDDETPASVAPVDVGGDVLALAAGIRHTCAVLPDRAVRCWGQGTWGRLGYGSTSDVGDDETPASAGDVTYE